MDGASEAIAYALDILNFDGVATPSSIEDVYLGDVRFAPWFEEIIEVTSRSLHI